MYLEDSENDFCWWVWQCQNFYFDIEQFIIFQMGQIIDINHPYEW